MEEAAARDNTEDSADGEARRRARDAQKPGHRAHEWKGSSGRYLRGGGPIEVIRQEQRTWAELHPEQLLKWTFPTKRRDCIRLSFRAIERMEVCASTDFRLAFGELVGRCPPIVTRSLGYLYLNYLQPHHKNIPAKGRHLLMLKVYEGKGEAHVWFVPLAEVRTQHKQAAEVMKGGVSLNDVQLVETYVVESTLALHCETFSRCASEAKAGGRGNQYGECTWIGGMAIHMIFEDADDKLMEKSLEFSAVPEGALAELSKKGEKMRAKRARKKANQKARKNEAAAVQAEEERQAREEMEAAADQQRKETLIKPHESLCTLFKSGDVQSPTSDDDITTSDED